MERRLSASSGRRMTSPAAGAWAAIQRELGSICYRILGNTAVFKDKELTVKFMEGLGFKTV